MPKGSETLTNARRNEIIEACAKLYQTMSFKDITIKEIGGVISFTRTSIYNYFQTKEEIFLALLKQEYELWVAELQSIMDECWRSNLSKVPKKPATTWKFSMRRIWICILVSAAITAV